MIVSKPQTSTTVSFVFFLLITIAVIYINVLALSRDIQAAWYNYAVVAILTSIGIFVFYRIFIRYKVLRLGNNQIRIDFPVLRKSRTYSLGEVDQWVESKVKTGKNSEYKELQVRFADGRKINIGHKEYTDYTRVVQYLTQKIPRKKGTAA